MVQLGGFLVKLLEPLLNTGLPLRKNLFKLLAHIVLFLRTLTAAVSAADAAIQKKFFASGMTTLIFSIEELNDNVKVVKPREDSGLLIKDVKQLKRK